MKVGVIVDDENTHVAELCKRRLCHITALDRNHDLGTVGSGGG